MSTAMHVPLSSGDPPPLARPERVALPVAPRKQAAGENFPVALRLLPARFRRALLALYGYARYVDDIGDEFDGPRVAALNRVADEVRALYRGERVRVPAVAGLALLKDAYRTTAQPFLDLVAANLQDQTVTRYQSFTELREYCRLSANPVGRVVLSIAGAEAAPLLVLSDRVCTGLQIVEHLQDVREDYRAGRIYLPQDDMARFAVAEADLAAATASSALRDLVRYQTDRAVAYLDAGAPLVSALHGAARIAVGGFLAGGRAAAATIRRAGFDVLSHNCSPPGRRVAAAFLRAAVRTPG